MSAGTLCAIPAGKDWVRAREQRVIGIFASIFGRRAGRAECDRCDLYRNEDDEAVVRRAGSVAEKEWREREGMIGVKGLGGGREEVVKKGWWEVEWTAQGIMDWWIKGVLAC